MDDKDLKLQQIVNEYIIGTHWQNRKFNDMTATELAELMKEVIDYGIRNGYLAEIEAGEGWCKFKVL